MGAGSYRKIPRSNRGGGIQKINKMKAYVLIKTGEGKAKKALNEIRNLEGVLEAEGVYGTVDLVVKIEGNNLADLVVDEIREIDGVKDTNTLIVAL